MKLPNLILAVLFAATTAGTEDLRRLVTDRDLVWPLPGTQLSLSAYGAVAETDTEGRAVIGLPNDFERRTLMIRLPGFDDLKSLVVLHGQDEPSFPMGQRNLTDTASNGG